MRKPSLLTNALLAAVLLGAAANVMVFSRYLQVLGTAQRLQLQTSRLQAQATAINQNFAVARSLAAEALGYAQQHPAMEPVVKAFVPLFQRMQLVSVSAAR